LPVEVKLVANNALVLQGKALLAARCVQGEFRSGGDVVAQSVGIIKRVRARISVDFNNSKEEGAPLRRWEFSGQQCLKMKDASSTSHALHGTAHTQLHRQRQFRAR